MYHQCKKCLLLESGERNAYNEIKALIDNMDKDIRVDEAEYASRLDSCKDCEYLISGMCRKCGCYVELRAVQKKLHCPDADNVRW